MVDDPGRRDPPLLRPIFEVYLHRLLIEGARVKGHHLLVQVGVSVAGLILLNVLVQGLSATTLPRQVLRHCEESELATDLFLGNSTMAAGLDEAAFLAAAPGRRGLNAALGGTPPVEHYLIYSRQDRHAAAGVYYGFYDTQLTGHPTGDWDTLVGNR